MKQTKKSSKIRVKAVRNKSSKNRKKVMIGKSEYLKVKRTDLIQVLKILEVYIVSSDRIGSWAHEHSKEEIYKMFFLFWSRWSMFYKIAEIRRILSNYFSDKLGSDNMAELEREFKDVVFLGV